MARGEGDASTRFALSLRHPAPVPPDAGQLVDIVLRRGIGEATRIAERFKPDLSEDLLNDVAFGLTGEGATGEALAVLQLRCDLHPGSWEAQAALADRLLEAGDRDAALRAYRKAEELIASGAEPEPAEWTREAIRDGIKKAEGQ
jgi:hypothetical protein